MNISYYHWLLVVLLTERISSSKEMWKNTIMKWKSCWDNESMTDIMLCVHTVIMSKRNWWYHKYLTFLVHFHLLSQLTSHIDHTSPSSEHLRVPHRQTESTWTKRDMWYVGNYIPMITGQVYIYTRNMWPLIVIATHRPTYYYLVGKCTQHKLNIQQDVKPHL